MSDSNKDQDPELSPEEKLRMENEIEKLKLSAFNDAEFFSSSELPPEIENEWLKYIAHFEKEHEDVDRITVAEKLDHPEFPAVGTLSGKEIEQQLDTVQQLMAEHGIFIDAIAEVSATELYRFITEELFLEQIDDVDIEGLQTCFIYEEFYPNDKLDIEMTLDDFIREMLNEYSQPYLDVNLADSCRSVSGELLTVEEILERIVAYTNQYDTFWVDSVDGFKILMNETKDRASARFEISYRGISGDHSKRYQGEAKASLRKGELGYWNIVTLDMPGFAF